jgi:hypothetical protein
MVRIVASRDHHMMRLMMHSSRHHAEKPEPAKLFNILDRNQHGENRSGVRVGGSEFPVADAVHRPRVRQDHSLDGIP